MKMLREVILKLAHTPHIRRLLEEEPDLSVFKERPSTRLSAGLVLMGVSYVICWPLIGLLGVMTWKLREPLIFSIGSPLAYLFSHFVFVAGAWLAGPDAVNYGKILYRWLVRGAFQKMLGATADHNEN